MGGPNSEQASFWEDLAPSWLAAEDHHERIAEPFGKAAMRDALATKVTDGELRLSAAALIVSAQA